VLTIESSGVAETLSGDWAAPIGQALAAASMLGRSETLADIGNVAAFVASDRAASMTATTINITCGREVD
jgi:enoyl-[acyl-carrier-protein] reductase (NADH)